MSSLPTTHLKLSRIRNLHRASTTTRGQERNNRMVEVFLYCFWKEKHKRTSYKSAFQLSTHVLKYCRIIRRLANTDGGPIMTKGMFHRRGSRSLSTPPGGGRLVLVTKHHQPTSQIINSWSSTHWTNNKLFFFLSFFMFQMPLKFSNPTKFKNKVNEKRDGRIRRTSKSLQDYVKEEEAPCSSMAYLQLPTQKKNRV